MKPQGNSSSFIFFSNTTFSMRSSVATIQNPKLLQCIHLIPRFNTCFSFTMATLIFYIFIMSLHYNVNSRGTDEKNKGVFLEKNLTAEEQLSKQFFQAPRRSVPKSAIAGLHSLQQTSSIEESLPLQCSTYFQGQRKKRALYVTMKTSGQELSLKTYEE